MNYELARHNMIENQIKTWNVHDPRILDVMANTAREQFVPKAYKHLAYMDTEIPLDQNQVMWQPKLIAKALDVLKLQVSDRVLEIGTGSGYVTSLLSQLTQHVCSVEYLPELHQLAINNLNPCECPNVCLFEADAHQGFEKDGPYDAILSSGSYPNKIPQALGDQLATNGRLFVIKGQGPMMNAYLITKKGPNQYEHQSLFETQVPHLLNLEQATEFFF